MEMLCGYAALLIAVVGVALSLIWSLFPESCRQSEADYDDCPDRSAPLRLMAPEERAADWRVSGKTIGGAVVLAVALILLALSAG